MKPEFDTHSLINLSTERLRILGMLKLQKGSVNIIELKKKNNKIVYLVSGLPDSFEHKHLIESTEYSVMEIKPYGIVYLFVRYPSVSYGTREHIKAIDIHTGEWVTTNKYIHYRCIAIGNNGEVIFENISLQHDTLNEYNDFDENYDKLINSHRYALIKYIIKQSYEVNPIEEFIGRVYHNAIPIVEVSNYGKYQLAHFGLTSYRFDDENFVLFNTQTGKVEAYGLNSASQMFSEKSCWVGVAEDSIVAIDLKHKRVHIEKMEIPENTVNSYRMNNRYQMLLSTSLMEKVFSNIRKAGYE